jgi:hypothetical protein
MITKNCACPDHEEFITKNPNTKYIKGHSRKGKVMPEEQKKRQSLAMKAKPPWSLERRKQQSQRLTGKPRKPWTQETIDKVRKANTGQKRSQEFRENCSRQNKERWANGLYNFHQTEEYKEKLRQTTSRSWAAGKMKPDTSYSPYGIRTVYHGVQMRSKFEARYAKICYTLGIKAKYEPKRFRLEYCTYCPDFYLPKSNTWVECKYEEDYTKHPELMKVDLLREAGRNIIIVTGKEVANLEKLLNITNVFTEIDGKYTLLD